jgi:hypothetical protein
MALKDFFRDETFLGLRLAPGLRNWSSFLPTVLEKR